MRGRVHPHRSHVLHDAVAVLIGASGHGLAVLPSRSWSHPSASGRRACLELHSSMLERGTMVILWHYGAVHPPCPYPCSVHVGGRTVWCTQGLT